MTDQKQVERLSEAYQGMNMKQRLAVDEIISMSVLKGVQEGINAVKNKVQKNEIDLIYIGSVTFIKTEYKLLID